VHSKDFDDLSSSGDKICLIQPLRGKYSTKEVRFSEITNLLDLRAEK